MLSWAGAMLQEGSNIVSHRRLRWLGHLAKMLDDRLPKRVLFGHVDGTAARFRGRALKQWLDYVGRTCSSQASHSVGGRDPRTRQHGGLP